MFNPSARLSWSLFRERRRTPRQQRRSLARRRPSVELLEPYILLSNIFTVTNTSGNAAVPNSLGWCLGQVNSNWVYGNASLSSIPRTIDFDIPENDPGYDAATNTWKIEPQSQFGDIFALVTINGESQPGYNGTPVIQLDGSDAGPITDSSFPIGLAIYEPGSTIEGLDITDWAGYGIYIPDYTGIVTGSVVEGNDIGIGTPAMGSQPLPNGAAGIFIYSSQNNTIGATASGAGNVIADNGGDGVTVDAAGKLSELPGHTQVDNEIEGNSIYGNGGLGIDLEALETSYNPVFQPAPVINSASITYGSTMVAGTVPGGSPTVEFFSNALAGPNGYGQGETYLGETSTDASGNFDVNLPVEPRGQAVITATATDPYGNVGILAGVHGG